MSVEPVPCKHLCDKYVKLDAKIRELRQNVVYCVNDYDYHHKNDKHEILEANLKNVADADEDCRHLVTSCDKFEKLLDETDTKLIDMREKFDKFIAKKNLQRFITEKTSE